MRVKYCAICGKEFNEASEIVHDCLVMEFNSKNQIVDKRWFAIHKTCYEELFIANTEEA